LAGSGICTQLAYTLGGVFSSSSFFPLQRVFLDCLFSFPSEVERAFSAVQQPGTGEICIPLPTFVFFFFFLP
jgi:hypothetical protein